MKKLFGLLLLASLSFKGFSQTLAKPAEDSILNTKEYLLPKPVAPLPDEVYTSVEHLPEFEGGLKALKKYFSKNLKYPVAAKAQNIHGQIVAQFLIEKDGSLSNIELKRLLGGGCDEEAIRLIQAMPKWKPGIQNGHPVKVSYILPIIF